MDTKILITTSSEETQRLAEELSRELRGGEVIALYGDLGSGKTTFTQGLAKGLGIEGRVTSPTFLILRTYSLSKDSSLQTLYHIDAYRLGNYKEAETIGFYDILQDKKGVVVLEWPEKVAELLPEKVIKIYFEYIEDDKRKINIKR